VIQSTGYLTGVFTDEEIISANVTTKDTKIKFLEKLITAIRKLLKKNYNKCNFIKIRIQQIFIIKMVYWIILFEYFENASGYLSILGLP